MNTSVQSAETEAPCETSRKSLMKGEKASASEVTVMDDELTRPLRVEDPRLLTVVEVAGILAIGRSKVYELLYRGELKSVKIGSSRRVRYSDLGEFVRYLDDVS